jgi:hypothetical protein
MKLPKFEMPVVEVLVNSCQSCKYRSPEEPGECLAFLDGIPDEILDGLVDHKKPYPGDNGIQYEPVG